MLKGKVLVISVLREVVDSAGSRATKLSVNDWNEQIKAASEEVTLGASAEPGARWPPRPYGTNVSLWEAVKDSSGYLKLRVKPTDEEGGRQAPCCSNLYPTGLG